MGFQTLLSNALSASVDPAHYLQSIGWDAYDWQLEVLHPGIDRLILNCVRQSGKSTVIGAKVIHKAKYFPNSLIMLFAPTENQAAELMEKISAIIKLDPEIILVRDSSITKKFLNGSRIKAFTANPKSARGYADPAIIVFDEAAYVEKELYLTVRPMMTGGMTELVLLSTPGGKSGFFFEVWHRDNELWTKVLVKPRDVLPDVLPNEYDPIDIDVWKRENAEKGIKAFTSPRHKVRWLLEELDEMGDHFFMQEYGCEFLESLDNVFSLDAFMRCFDDEGDIEPMEDYRIETTEEEALWHG